MKPNENNKKRTDLRTKDNTSINRLSTVCEGINKIKMIQTEGQPKYMTYAALISEKIGELIDEEISMEELQEDDNLTEFFHALANVAPNLIYGGIVGSNVNSLEFNHLANKLCFQYLNRSEGKEDSNEDKG